MESHVHKVSYCYGHALDYFQKSLGVHKILVCKIWLYSPTPEKGPNEETLSKLVENFKIVTFPGGGGGKRNFMDKTILWTSGRF